MIDTLIRILPKSKIPNIEGLSKDYILVTLHRPSNVDHPKVLLKIINTLKEIGKLVQVLFPVHPRTRKMLNYNNINL